MNVTIRLYKLHDYDLIYLYKNLRFPVGEAIRKALTGYVRCKPVFFDFPVEAIENDELVDVRDAQFHFALDPETEGDLIEYLSGLKRYYRNSFLKNLLRGYLAGPPTYVYEENVNIEEAKKRAELNKGLVLGIETLSQRKPRKKRKKYVILTEEQKKLFDAVGALDDVDVVIRNDPREVNGAATPQS